MLGYLGYDDAKLRKKMKLYKISAETGCQKKEPPYGREIEQIILKLRHC